MEMRQGEADAPGSASAIAEEDPVSKRVSKRRCARPDLPRWIASSKCDSGAMLGAFLHYKQQCTTAEAEALKELYSIEHADAGFAVINGQVVVPRKIESSVPSRPCSAPSCERCETLKGGYQFRWYSPKWDAEYRRGARPGAWHPGEPE